jgi:hypothetical protein
MRSNFIVVLLTVLTLSVFTIAIVELSGISNKSISARFWSGNKGAEGSLFAHQPLPLPPVDERTQQVNGMPKTTMEFAEKKFNFGEAPEGKQLKHAFKFKNTGPNPLMISKTDVSCGCTVPSFPKEPIAPGGEGEITVVFNSQGKSGVQQKNILVHSNAALEAVSISIEADIK